MNYAFIVIPQAEADIKNAYSWYEESSEGLGSDFLLCLEEVLNRIQRNPKIYPIIHNNIRRALIRRFPYGIFYKIEEDGIFVLAVFHARRDPKNWKKRN